MPVAVYTTLVAASVHATSDAQVVTHCRAKKISARARDKCAQGGSGEDTRICVYIKCLSQTSWEPEAAKALQVCIGVTLPMRHPHVCNSLRTGLCRHQNLSRPRKTCVN
jgi:hypothetical protein